MIGSVFACAGTIYFLVWKNISQKRLFTILSEYPLYCENFKPYALVSQAFLPVIGSKVDTY